MPIKIFFSLLISHLSASIALAQFYTPPIASSMGGAGRAGNSPSESSFLNPATLSQLRNYYGAVDYDWGDHPNDGSTSDIAALLADGTPDKSFPGQFSYVQRKVTLPNGYSTTLQDFQLGIAYAPNEFFGLGVSIHRELYHDNANKDFAQNNLNLGTIYQPFNQFTVAFVAYDILGGDNAVPQPYQTIPTLAVAGTFRYKKSFTFSADLVRPDKFNDGDRLNTSFGIETLFSEYFAFRTGWQWREVGSEEKLFSFGVGYRGPRLSFDYSFQKDVLAGFGYRQFVDLWLHF